MRNRSMALAVRDGRILMVKTLRRGGFVWELPGGGIETSETPQEAALRELKEESGLDGVIVRPLTTLYGRDGSREYVFLAEVPDNCEAIVGSDPEAVKRGEKSIRAVGWKKLNELSERDRAFLWTDGLMSVDGFFELALSWGEEVSYPAE